LAAIKNWVSDIKRDFMKTFFSFFLLLVFFLLSNCNINSTEKNEKATEYFNSISDIMSSTKKPSDDFSNYFKKIAPLAKANPNYQVDSTKIDSLKAYYNSMSSNFAHTINKLKSLQEFDTAFNTLNLAINGYEIMKNGYDSTIPSYLKVYATGWMASSISDKEIILQASQILNRSFEASTPKTDSFGIQITQFAKKYNIKY
jgi:hypothetical protein